MNQRNLKMADVSVGDETHEIEIPITLQRLVMEAGANRDFSLIHHDKKVAQSTGAADAYANTFFLMGMFERLLREWMGPSGLVRKLGPMKMTSFNCVGDSVRFSGQLSDIDAQMRLVTLNLTAQTENGQTASCVATVKFKE